MAIPEPIKENEGGKRVLKDKVNALIEHLMGKEAPAAPVPEKGTDTEGEAKEPFSFEGFSDAGVAGFLNAPQGGFTDDTGLLLVGMVKLDRVPAPVREAYRAWQQPEG